jgi:hypothetical protein
MVGALASTGTSTAQAAGATGGLDAQLARYQKQLAECVNCTSSKTPDGKREIDDLYGKIHSIKAKLEDARGSGPVRQASPAEPVSQAPGATSTPQATQAEQATPARRASAWDTAGSVIDTYA